MACQPCWVSPGPLPTYPGGSILPAPSDLPSCSPGDLGGQMGLFIGASILTLLEILDYIYEARGLGSRRCGKGRGPVWAPDRAAGWEVELRGLYQVP